MKDKTEINIWFYHPVQNRSLVVGKTLEEAFGSIQLMTYIGWRVADITLTCSKTKAGFSSRNLRNYKYEKL